MGLLLVVAAGGSPLLAEDTYWARPADSINWYWTLSDNWDHGVPNAVDHAHINNGGTACLTLSGAACSMLYLADVDGNRGVLDFSAGGLTVGSTAYVGYGGGGRIRHSGGLLGVGGDLCLGHGPDANGIYQLSGDANLSVADTTCVGGEGTGDLVQTGGVHTAKVLRVGDDAGGVGTCDLQEGLLHVLSSCRIGNDGHGTVMQSGGQFAAPPNPILGYGVGGVGEYELSGGTFSTGQHYYVGWQGTANVRQTGGDCNVAWALSVGTMADANATYTIDDGNLSLGTFCNVAPAGTGRLSQAGGRVTVGQHIYLGTYSGADGTLALSGGDLEARRLYVGKEGTGRLEMLSAAPNVVLLSGLHIGADGHVQAVPGATIHMAGAQFDNQSTAPADVAGLANLTLSFEGGPAVTDDVEAAGRDRGLDPNGWTDNFVLGTLQLGGPAGCGRIRLVDARDNHPTWDGNEALYVEKLLINAGAQFAASDVPLYFRETDKADDANDPKRLFAGDATLDGQVSAADLSLLADHWGAATGAVWREADFTGDGAVSAADLSLLADNWGQGVLADTAGASCAPEPASALLVALGAAGLLGRRKRR
jgi:hypothetical protein